MNIRTLISLLASVALVGIICISAVAQNRASVHGQVSDEFGASIVGATVTVTDANGAAKTATTGPDGTYTINGLAPGKYKVHAASAGFATSDDAEVEVAANRREPVNITLKIAAIESQVKVNADTPLSTEQSNNANQQELSGKALDALPDDNDLVRATVLNSALQPVDFGLGALVPRRNTNLSPRFDYAINSKNTLIARYNFFEFTAKNSGIGGFTLPQRAFESRNHNHNVQLTETAVINAFTINETRFQFSHNRSENLGNSTLPVLNVSGAFNGCLAAGANCSQVGHSLNTRSNWELNNFTQIQKGMHTLKFGGRIRGVSIDDLSPNNAGGQWTFTGGFGPQLDASNNPIAGTNVVLSSIERYRRTLLVKQNGLTQVQKDFCVAGTSLEDCIRKLGGGAAQFSINTGNFAASVSQIDVGFYWQDDWRVRPNLTFSYGLRYENQTNISSKFNFAPRMGFAWSPGAANATRPPKTVIRGGGGIFYNRFGEGSTLTAGRFNGSNELSYVLA